MLPRRNRFVSLIEVVDLTTPTDRAMVALFLGFAEFEHEILREQIRADIAEARPKGKHLGRPLTVTKKSDQIRKLHRNQPPPPIGRTSVRRIQSTYSNGKYARSEHRPSLRKKRGGGLSIS